MKVKFCRYCKQDVSMFNDDEYATLSKIYTQCQKAIKIYRQKNNVSLEDVPKNQMYQPFIDEYKILTGKLPEYPIEEIMQNHFLSRWREYRGAKEEVE